MFQTPAFLLRSVLVFWTPPWRSWEHFPSNNKFYPSKVLEIYPVKHNIFCCTGSRIYTRSARRRWMNMPDACTTIQMNLKCVAKSSKHSRKHVLWNETLSCLPLFTVINCWEQSLFSRIFNEIFSLYWVFWLSLCSLSKNFFRNASKLDNFIEELLPFDHAFYMILDWGCSWFWQRQSIDDKLTMHFEQRQCTLNFKQSRTHKTHTSWYTLCLSLFEH